MLEIIDSHGMLRLIQTERGWTVVRYAEEAGQYQAPRRTRTGTLVGPATSEGALYAGGTLTEEKARRRYERLVRESSPRHVYGVAEVAAACGVEPKRVAQWLARGNYAIPEPDVRLAATPIWYASTIEPWIRERRAAS